MYLNKSNGTIFVSDSPNLFVFLFLIRQVNSMKNKIILKMDGVKVIVMY